MGQISSSYRERFESLGSTRVLMYYSQRKGILGEKMVSRISTYDVAAEVQAMDYVPPYYKADGNSLDFNNS